MSSLSAPSPFDPPPHFSLIHPHLYRTSTFTSLHLPFLRPLQLRTVLSLGPELPSRALQSYFDNEEGKGVRFVHLGAGRGREMGDWRPVREELIKEALEFVLEKRNMPCLVMDQSGIHETGILVGCLRKLERWTLSAVLAEYASLAGSRTRGSNEQFIELFDTDLVVIPQGRGGSNGLWTL
ncbi:protein-tyrosine phosphatase [Leucosporidium creatinivorum]|uniref:Protein-tyrosine phosphatase n=1 Tax=Leucosporidium creatinivorum TaxID=106004 RepID=A0A1Y2G077_9BASI|nr:protein-tyrosine phosphatase [Leucosporidium creatinivorum]